MRATAGVAVLGCVLLAVLSVLLLPSTPSYDPWAWIVWGREIVSSHFSFATAGGPSWKPLPVVFTTVFGLLGGAAPKLWLIVARAGGLLALLAAYRLGARLAGARVAGVLAGLLAAVALLLTQETVGSVTQDWVHYLFRGASEPMLVACVLWAIDRHLEGRRASAFVLGVAMSLIRPEAWPFLGLYALWLWREQPRLRPLLIGGVALIPLLWFVPPWVSAGQPLAASTQAQDYNGHLGSDPVLETLRRGAELTIVPVLLAALAAALLAWRARDRTVLALCAGALAWVALVVVMALAGYPGLGRFMYPAAGVLCVLAGVGVVRLAMLAGAGVRFWSVAALVVAATVPFAVARVRGAVAEKHQADLAVSITTQLDAAVRGAGGAQLVLPCRASLAGVNHTMQTELAWTLGAPLSHVKTSIRSPAVDFLGPHLATIDGAAAPIRLAPYTSEPVAHAGVWQVLRVTQPGATDGCVGR
ncbi:MAG: hypothetical protein DLM64_08780 [Solirubrobacterales bacterium]|nr:MAG: hypothetical protein DLM64_08780 [Solirubrobacterales bacterium]